MPLKPTAPFFHFELFPSGFLVQIVGMVELTTWVLASVAEANESFQGQSRETLGRGWWPCLANLSKDREAVELQSFYRAG